MRRITLFLMLTALCLSVMAQGKLTPQARLNIERQKAKAFRQLSSHSSMGGESLAPAKQNPLTVKLVVKVSADKAAETFTQMKAAGATICSKLGQQAVIRIPVDSVPALERIEGVLRIDKGHKGHLKTDVTRNVSGVNLLNGPDLPATATAYTGQGVLTCVLDGAFDFHHPAFKDSEGRSRIKCVYVGNSDEGRKFTINDPEAGKFTFSGSLFDTPELIATLTTDMIGETHGTHTAAIAAGSITPQGFGGMAPEADIVLIPIGFINEEDYDNEDDIIEEALAFAVAYAQECHQPMVLSVSMNSHSGPHDGTSSVTEAIETASESIVPVFSAGNEGSYPIHLSQKFTNAKTSIKTLLIAITEEEDDSHPYYYFPDVVGYTRAGDEVSVQLALMSINMMGRLSTVWTSEKFTATPGCEMVYQLVTSEEDETLAQYFDGMVGIAAYDNGDGRLAVNVMADGGMDDIYLFQLTISGSANTEIDLWDNLAGFGGRNFIGLSGYVDGDSEMSAGDWTCTDRVISVGAYCANILHRDYDGTVTDTSVGDNKDEDYDVLNDIAWFSSYGTSFNDVAQPTVCAPGVNIVSAWSQYAITEGTSVSDQMQWQNGAYSAESGTSMACPVVSGIVALWLQADPTLTFDDVKDVLAHSSDTSDTTDNPVRWGYGKIDAAKGIEYLTNVPSGIKEVTPNHPSAHSASSHHRQLYDLQGRSVVGKPVSGIYVSNGKKVVVRKGIAGCVKDCLKSR